MDEHTDDHYFDATWDECPECGAAFSGDEYILQQCFACGWVNDTGRDDVEFPDEFDGHEDIYIEVDGQQQRVLGDPNMSEETKQALAGLIKAASEAIERGDFDKDNANEV